MFIVILLSVFLQTALGCHHCPSGKYMSLPRANCVDEVFGPFPFSFSIDNDGYAGPDSDALAFTGEQPQLSSDSVVYIQRDDFGKTFRFIDLSFSVEFVKSIIIRVYNKDYNYIEALPPIFLGIGQTFVHITRPEEDTLPGATRYEFLPEDGIPNLGRITIEFQSDFNKIQFWGMYLDACSRGPLWSPDSLQFLNEPNQQSGNKIFKPIKSLVKWVKKLKKKHSSLWSKLNSAIQVVERSTNRFNNKAGTNYVYGAVPTNIRSMVDWTKKRYPEAQILIQTARNSLQVFEDLVANSLLSAKDMQKGFKALDGVHKVLSGADQSILETGSRYPSNSLIGQSSGLLDQQCSTTSQCPRGRICCDCRCRFPQECREIAAQAALRSCISNKTEVAYSKALTVFSSTYNSLCFLADDILIGKGLNPKLGHQINVLKLLAVLLGGPQQQLPFPGRPPIQLTEKVTEWLLEKHEQVQNDVEKTRQGLREIRREILRGLNPAEQSRANLSSLLALMSRLMSQLDVVDRTLVATNICYMNYVKATVLYVPLPQ